jgi:hypothetical protein
MQERLKTLLERDHAGKLTPSEQIELDEYERIEHIVIMLKTGNPTEELFAERQRLVQ